MNFTWWVNRKDPQGKHLFAGGFLGLDNIGVFDRSKPLPNGGRSSRPTAPPGWPSTAARCCRMALELADGRSGLRGHRLEILRALRPHRRRHEHPRRHGLVGRGGRLLLRPAAHRRPGVPLRLRSMVGLIPLLGRRGPSTRPIDDLPGFHKRLVLVPQAIAATWPGTSPTWRRSDSTAAPAAAICWRSRRGSGWCACSTTCSTKTNSSRPSAFARFRRSTAEALRFSLRRPGVPRGLRARRVRPGLFGGNSNWRGPVWFPLNYLLIEALERYHHFYGDGLKVECPTGSGRWMTLDEVARELATRLVRLFRPDANGRRPYQGKAAGVGQG